MRCDYNRFSDILEAIERIEKYSVLGRDKFESDELIQVWIVYHLLVIGEACRSLSSDIIENYPELPLREVIGMRNVLIHEYFGIDLDIVWGVVEQSLQPFKNMVEDLIDRSE